MEGPGGRLIAASGESGTASGVVRRRSCAGGFSLMEVLFAVLVLTMGLVFVAANFPLGIMNAAKVAESTRTIIDTHNAQIMTELQLDAIVADPCTHLNYSLEAAIDCSDYTGVRLLDKPNVLVDYYPPRVVIDNPEGDSSMGTVVYSSINWLFWSDDKGKLFTDDYLGDIGPIVSPPVDVSDRDVQKILQADGYDPTIPSHFFNFLQPAIFEVSMERKNSWCVLYRQVRPDSKEFCFYVFALRSLPNARYAMQGDFTTILSVAPQPSDVDRRFPVPWRIELNNPVLMVPETDWFLLENHTVSQLFADNLAKILQGGSIIIDAQYGHIYKVTEVALVEDGQMVRLDGILMDDLLTFWVFPPPIVRTGSGDDDYIFEGKQPVVKVTQKNLRF